MMWDKLSIRPSSPFQDGTGSYTPEEMTQLIQDYKDLGEEGLWKNLEYFIKEVMPVAVENDVNMAIHPDDPPWPIRNPAHYHR